MLKTDHFTKKSSGQTLERWCEKRVLCSDPIAQKVPLELAMDMDAGIEVVYSLAGECPADFLDTTLTTVRREKLLPEEGSRRRDRAEPSSDNLDKAAADREEAEDEGDDEVATEEVEVTLRERLLDYGLERLEGASAAEIRRITLWRNLMSQRPVRTEPASRARAQRHFGNKSSKSRDSLRQYRADAGARSAQRQQGQEEAGGAAQERVECRGFLTSIYLHGYTPEDDIDIDARAPAMQ
jgi:hypothetical protein